MIPLRDNNPRNSFPWITLALIAANSAIFFREAFASETEIKVLFASYGLIPTRATGFFSGEPVSPSAAIFPFVTSMFLHGGWMHLIGNMWFLWIFGDNVEDRTGHLSYLFLYLASGLAGSVGHVLFSPDSTVPTVGASGAISGVMGAYLITFPRARILTLVPIIVFLTTVEIPAYLILIYWLLLQFLSGVASLAADTGQGGVAWFAHVGGFVVGVPLMLALRRRRRR
jgi:membrane associated rhomboid family serine protease